uniref:Uncharacterized protein n=1 Tax=Salmonella sp. TaxID=599 RepID=A0A482EX36_SALSP|nr:hypothetical protein NNIBIDOC_00075 [Salmonella sp.]
MKSLMRCSLGLPFVLFNKVSVAIFIDKQEGWSRCPEVGFPLLSARIFASAICFGKTLFFCQSCAISVSLYGLILLL